VRARARASKRSQPDVEAYKATSRDQVYSRRSVWCWPTIESVDDRRSELIAYAPDDPRVTRMKWGNARSAEARLPSESSERRRQWHRSGGHTAVRAAPGGSSSIFPCLYATLRNEDRSWLLVFRRAYRGKPASPISRVLNRR